MKNNNNDVMLKDNPLRNLLTNWGKVSGKDNTIIGLDVYGVTGKGHKRVYRSNGASSNKLECIILCNCIQCRPIIQT